MPDDPSAALEYYRERGKREVAAARDVVTRHSGENILTLVAALEAVLALPDEWEKEAARLDGISEGSTDPQQRAAISMRAQAFEECGRDLREAVTSALTGATPPSPAAAAREAETP